MSWREQEIRKRFKDLITLSYHVHSCDEDEDADDPLAVVCDFSNDQDLAHLYERLECIACDAGRVRNQANELRELVDFELASRGVI